jgi:hypothetical protein
MRLIAIVLLAGCATQETPVRPAATPVTEALQLRDGTPGECEPVEYTVRSEKAYEVQFRVKVSLRGFAAQVSLSQSSGDSDNDDLALDLVRRVFHCRHPLAVSAKRMIEAYPIHFGPVVAPKMANPDQCVQALRNPSDRPYPSNAAPLALRIALDDQGSVLRAWSPEEDSPWYLAVVIEALEHRCRFLPAQRDGTSVAYVFPYTLDFSGDRVFDRIYPVQEHHRF